MFEKFQNYFRDRYIYTTLKKASSDIFTTEKSFEEVLAKYDTKTDSFDRILTFAILNVSSQRTPRTKSEKHFEVIKLYLKNIKETLYFNSDNEKIEIFILNAELEFLKSKKSRLIDKENIKFDEYSLSSMIYKMENANKGSLTAEQMEFIQISSAKLDKINEQIKNKESETKINNLAENKIRNKSFFLSEYSKENFDKAMLCVNDLIQNNEKSSQLHMSYKTLKYSKEKIELSFYYLLDSVLFDEYSPIYENKDFANNLRGLHMMMLLNYLDVEPNEIPKNKFEEIKFGGDLRINLGKNQLEITGLINWRNREQWIYFANNFGLEDELGKLCLEKSSDF